MARALVTGAAGFIGAHVVRVLRDAGHEVRAMHLPGEDARNLAGLDVERIAGDVRDLEGVSRAARGCRWIFHLAAVYSLAPRDASRMWSVNVGGTRAVLDAARAAGVERVVVTSSIARFGGQGRGVRATEESPFRLAETGDVYSQTKAAAHEVALDAARAGQDVVVVAPTGPIGPGDVRPTPTGRLILLAAVLPVAIVTRTASNFADVRDMARGHLLAAERGARGEAYLLGHEDVEVADLARRARRAARARGVAVVSVPASLARLGGRLGLAIAERSGAAPILTPAAVDIARLELRADCSKARRALGLECGSLDRALEDAIEWFRREGYARRPFG